MADLFKNKKTVIQILFVLNLLTLSFAVFLLVELKRVRDFNFTPQIRSLTLPLLSQDTQRTDVFSRAYIVYDPLTRTVVFVKNEKLRFSPASGTKIMTAIIALEEYRLNDVLVASNLEEVEGSMMGLFEGEAITVENLLYGLLLPSGNDAAYVLASAYRPLEGNSNGGINGFVSRMNEKARELNLTNTKFVDPTGLSDENYTTPYDIARLASYALKIPKFASIVSTKNKIITDATGTAVHNLTNLNELLGQKGVSGIKTGFTEEARGVLISSVNHKGRTYIIVVMGSPDRFLDTMRIIEDLEKITLVTY